MNPQDVSPIQVVSFLQHLFDTKTLAYSSFVAHRAALSLISSHDLNNDELIARFLKGIFRRRPPTPRYTSTWDPQPVIAYLSSYYPDSPLLLSKKLLTLMLLASGHRLQTMAAIQIPNIHFSESGVSIFVDKLLKTSRPGFGGTTLTFPIYPGQPSLCIPTILKSFLRLTAPLRSGVDLFIISTPPYSPASITTLARWTKDILAASGVDISMYTAHSTRHASVSAAARKGVPADAIFKSAGWSSNSGMFTKIYNRPVKDPFIFSRSVLDQPTS